MPKARVKKVVSEPKDSLSVPKRKKAVTKTKVAKKKTLSKAANVKHATKPKKTGVKKRAIKSKKLEITNEAATVTLPPTTPSLRLLEKVELYRRWYHEMLPVKVSQSARAFAYLFIGLGTVFAAGSHLITNTEHPAAAAILCSTGACEEVADEDLPQGSPLISYLNEIPAIIKADKDFAIDVKNATDFKVYLVDLQTDEKTELQPTVASDKSKYRVEVSALVQGNYQIESVVDTPDTSYLFPSNIFTYEPEVDNEVEVLETAVVDEEESSEETEEEPLDQESLEDDLATSTISNSETENTIDDIDNEINNTGQEINTPVSISLKKDTNSVYLEVTTGEFLPESVEIYSRLAGFDSDLYLGQAYLVQNSWFFSLSAIELPQNEHRLFAVFELEGQKMQTESVTFNNQIASDGQESKPAEDITIKKKKIDLSLEAIGLSNEDRTNYYSNSDLGASVVTEIQFASGDVIAAVDVALDDKEDMLNGYLLNYAAAYQGGKSYLVKLAEDQINSYLLTLAEFIADNLDNPNLATVVETILSQRFSTIFSQVRVAEERLTLETNTLLQQDTDQDGISDYDELTNFNTNPTKPDTDEDSILDSVEIITFSDPLAPDLENYPQSESDLITEVANYISFSSVKRLVLTANNKEQIQYSIEGKSIPSAFVYLTDLDNDLIGVIRTNSTGDFYYTVDKPASQEAFIKAGIINKSGKYITSSANLAYNNKNQLTATLGEVWFIDEKLYDRLTSLNILTSSIALVLLGFVLLFLAQGVKARRKKFILTS